MGTVVGIDLGTSKSTLAVMQGSGPAVIATSNGKHIPSGSNPSKRVDRPVSWSVQQQTVSEQAATFGAVKHLLGRRLDEHDEVPVHPGAPIRVRRQADGSIAISFPNAQELHSPQEIAALILGRLKGDAEAHLGTPLDQAVLTVPAHFDDGQRQALREAAGIVGFDVLRIVNESTAAALAYGFHSIGEETILVVDLGGGTLDVSVLEVRDDLVAVKASHGDAFLGGQDWTNSIALWILEEFRRREGLDLRKDRKALQRIYEAAEEAKITLSTSTKTTLHLPFITNQANGPRHLCMTLTRSQFEQLSESLLTRLEGPLTAALHEAGLRAADLDAVLLVGGGTRIPAVREKIRSLTGHEPSAAVDPDEAVALGAAIQAGMLAGDVQNVELRDVARLSLGIETLGGVMTVLIPRNTPLPAHRTEVFGTAEDAQTTVNVHILQGERPMAAGNTSLGVFQLAGIPVAPRGVPQIEVTFAIDRDGLLQVSAHEISSATSETLCVKAGADLTEREVRDTVETATRHETEDRQQRELIDARNLAEQVAYQTERGLQYLEAHIHSAPCRRMRVEIVQMVERLRAAVDKQDSAYIRQLAREIQEAKTTLGQLLYGQADHCRSDARSGDLGGRPEAETGEQANIV